MVRIGQILVEFLFEGLWTGPQARSINLSKKGDDFIPLSKQVLGLHGMNVFLLVKNEEL